MICSSVNATISSDGSVDGMGSATARYRYVSNSPTNKVDPAGTEELAHGEYEPRHTRFPRPEIKDWLSKGFGPAVDPIDFSKNALLGAAIDAGLPLGMIRSIYDKRFSISPGNGSYYVPFFSSLVLQDAYFKTKDSTSAPPFAQPSVLDETKLDIGVVFNELTHVFFDKALSLPRNKWLKEAFQKLAIDRYSDAAFQDSTVHLELAEEALSTTIQHLAENVYYQNRSYLLSQRAKQSPGKYKGSILIRGDVLVNYQQAADVPGHNKSTEKWAKNRVSAEVYSMTQRKISRELYSFAVYIFKYGDLPPVGFASDQMNRASTAANIKLIMEQAGELGVQSPVILYQPGQ